VYIVLLKFSANQGLAGQYMAAHKAWLQQGFDEGVFLLAGSLLPGLGGAILAHCEEGTSLRDRVNADPFVVAGVVSAEIMEVAPSKAVQSLSFLVA